MDTKQKHAEEDREYNTYIHSLRRLSPSDRSRNRGVQSFLKILFTSHEGKEATQSDIDVMTKRCEKFFIDNPKRTKPECDAIFKNFDGRKIMVSSASIIISMIRQDRFAAKYL